MIETNDIKNEKLHTIAIKWQNCSDLHFTDLVVAIKHTHQFTSQTAIKARILKQPLLRY